MALLSQWLKLGKLLGLTFTSASSNRAVCPFCCRGRITFYNDPAVTGKRFVASCCQKSGDLLDLVGSLKQLNRTEAENYVKVQLPELHVDYQSCSSKRTEIEANEDKLWQLWDSTTTLSKVSNSQAIQQLLARLHLHFSHTLAWHTEGLDRQFRFMSHADLTSQLKQLSLRAEQLPPKNVAPGFLLSGIYQIPGQLSGIAVIWCPANSEPQTLLLLTDPAEQNPGYMVHPTTAITHSPVVVISDLRQYLRVSFWLMHHGDKPNPLVTFFDKPPLATKSVHMLQNREVIFWHHTLTSRILRAAARLGAQVSHFGFSREQITLTALERLCPYKLVDKLSERSMTWQSSLVSCAQHTTREELSELVSSADLSESQLTEAKDHLGDRYSLHLQELKKDVCQAAQYSGSFGLITQTPQGWILNSKGTEEVICNKPWRIVKAVQDGDDLLYEVAIYDAGRWVTLLVDQEALHAKPFATLTKACSQHQPQLSIFTGLPKWNQAAMHIALQLNPVVEYKVEHRTVGLDFQDGCFRTSQCQLPLESGQVHSIGGVRSRSLLPEADGTLPTKQELSKVIEHTPTCTFVSAVTLQMLSMCFGKTPPAITFGENRSLLMEGLLNECGFTAKDAAPILHLDPLLKRYSAPKLRAALTDLQPTWARSHRHTAFWAAAQRPVAHVSGGCSAELVVLSRSLQRVVLHLLSYSIKAANEGSQLTAAVPEGWKQLKVRCGYTSVVRPRTVHPLRPVDALAYWAGVGTRAGLFGVRVGMPKRPSPRTMYVRGDQFMISRDSFAEVLLAHKFTPWDMNQLLSHCINSPEFISHRRVDRLQMITLERRLLDKATNSMLDENRPSKVKLRA